MEWLEVVWDGTQRHPITGSRGGLTTYPTREFGGRELPIVVEPVAASWTDGVLSRAERLALANAKRREDGARTCAAVLDALHGWRSLAELEADIGLTPKGIRYHLRTLLASGQAERRNTGEGRRCRFEYRAVTR